MSEPSNGNTKGSDAQENTGINWEIVKTVVPIVFFSIVGGFFFLLFIDYIYFPDQPFLNRLKSIFSDSNDPTYNTSDSTWIDDLLSVDPPIEPPVDPPVDPPIEPPVDPPVDPPIVIQPPKPVSMILSESEVLNLSLNDLMGTFEPQGPVTITFSSPIPAPS